VFSKKQQQQQQHPHNTPKAHFECLMKKQQQHQQHPPQKKVSKKHPQSRWFRGNEFPQTLIIAAFVAPLGICFLPSFLPSLFCKIQGWCVA
jgi:thiol:disulfide interchange protein